MRPFYTDPHLHLLSYSFVVLLLIVVLFLRSFAPHYLPTYLLLSTWPDHAFSPFLETCVRALCGRGEHEG